MLREDNPDTPTAPPNASSRDSGFSIPGLMSHHVWTSFALDQIMKRICLSPSVSLYSKRRRSGRTKAVVKGFSTVRLPPCSTNSVLTTPESRYDLHSLHVFTMRSIISLAEGLSGFASL